MRKKVTLDKVENIYCIGIGGIGVSAAAKFLHLQEYQVSGSDAVESEMTEELRDMGIPVFIGNDENNLPENIDLVIYSPAVPDDNPERTKAREQKIPSVSYPEFLAMLSEKKYTIAISGTHGKSTTTALIGLMLKNAGFNPTVIVGSKTKAFSHGNLEMGESNIFVVEACEYQANMCLLNPDIAVVTNIEFDHPDFYQNADETIKAMQDFVNKLGEDGILVKNYDDKVIRAKLHSKGKTIMFGIGEDAQVCANNIVMQNGVSYFSATLKGNEGFLDEQMSMHVPGRFNVSNALAAIAVAHEMKVPIASIKDTLENYTGLWRRFEIVGEYEGAKIISDYAHHPTAVDATIHAAREWYPNNRIVVVYQPHQHARTKELFTDFVKSFHHADLVLMSDIYDVAGREETEFQDVSAKKLVDEIKLDDNKLNIQYTGDLEKTEATLKQQIKSEDIVIIMGAGTIDTIARNLI